MTEYRVTVVRIEDNPHASPPGVVIELVGGPGRQIVCPPPAKIETLIGVLMLTAEEWSTVRPAAHAALSRATPAP